MATPKQSTDTEANLAAILAHPLRARCLMVLAERVASPAELRTEFGVPIGDVSYHVKRLHELGAIELVDTQQVRGAVEHFYRANLRPMLSDEQIASLSLDERLEFARQVCLFTFADASQALEEKTFCERPDFYATRVPCYVDEMGWRKLSALYGEILGQIFDIEAESAERMAQNPESEPIRTSAVAMFFETPEPKRRPRR